MRAAVYARFSSENQREQSIEDQIRVCKTFAERDGITVLENHIYYDEAQSGDWGIALISVSDGLDMREEHAKVAYQFRGIINELCLTDLKKKTRRGQMGQVLGDPMRRGLFNASFATSLPAMPSPR